MRLPRLDPRRFSERRAGLTLFELLLVLGVLAGLASLVIPAVAHRLDHAHDQATRRSLQQIRDVLADTYYDDMGDLPRPGQAAWSAGRPDHPQLVYLFLNPETHLDNNPTTRDYDLTFDPVSRRGWRGPYLLHQGEGFRYEMDPSRGFEIRYGETGDPAALDGWGNPIVLQEPNAPGVGESQRLRHSRLVSAGPNGVIETDPDALMPTERGDDLVLFLWMADP
jgi:type II secretory pathway pseudopilin PulG